MNEILQAYADADLLDFQGSNDEFSYLEKASKTLEAQISNSEIPSFVLTAINPNVAPDNPNLLIVKKIISDEWKFFGKNAGTKDTQRTVLRAVILNGLNNLIIEDEKKAAIIWLSGQHFAEKITITNVNEKRIIQNLIQKAGLKHENIATTQFKINTPKFDFDLPKFSSFNLSKEEAEYEEEIEDEKGGIESVDEILGTNINTRPGNVHGVITKTNFDTWYKGFASKLTEVVNEMIDGEREALADYLSEVHHEFKSLYEIFANKIPNEINNSFKTLSNHNNLIWWKETLYSKSLQKSYRSVPNLVKVVSMAYDLSNELSQFSPISVDYFLKETLIKVLPDDEEITFNKLFERFKNDENNKYFTQFLVACSEGQEPSSLLNFLCSKLFDQSEKSFSEYTGIDEAEKISFYQLIVWLFHDFQVQKLIDNGRN